MSPFTVTLFVTNAVVFFCASTFAAEVASKGDRGDDVTIGSVSTTSNKDLVREASGWQGPAYGTQPYYQGSGYPASSNKKGWSGSRTNYDRYQQGYQSGYLGNTGYGTGNTKRGGYYMPYRGSAYPGVQGNYGGGYVGGQGGYAGGKGGYAGGQGGYVGGQGGYVGGQGGYVGGQGSYVGGQSGYVGNQGGYVGGQGGYVGSQGGYVGSQGGYPGAQPGYGNNKGWTSGGSGWSGNVGGGSPWSGGYGGGNYKGSNQVNQGGYGGYDSGWYGGNQVNPASGGGYNWPTGGYRGDQGYGGSYGSGSIGNQPGYVYGNINYGGGYTSSGMNKGGLGNQIYGSGYGGSYTGQKGWPSRGNYGNTNTIPGSQGGYWGGNTNDRFGTGYQGNYKGASNPRVNNISSKGWSGSRSGRVNTYPGNKGGW